MLLFRTSTNMVLGSRKYTLLVHLLCPITIKEWARLNSLKNRRNACIHRCGMWRYEMEWTQLLWRNGMGDITATAKKELSSNRYRIIWELAMGRQFAFTVLVHSVGSEVQSCVMWMVQNSLMARWTSYGTSEGTRSWTLPPCTNVGVEGPRRLLVCSCLKARSLTSKRELSSRLYYKLCLMLPELESGVGGVVAFLVPWTPREG